MEQMYNEKTREQLGEMIYKTYIEWDSDEDISLTNEQILLMREYAQGLEVKLGGQK